MENSPPTSPVNLIRVVPLPINGKHKVEEIVCSSGQDENDDNAEDNNDNDEDDGEDTIGVNGNNVSNHNDHDDDNDDDVDDDNDGNRFYQRKRPRTMHNDYSSFSNSRLSSSSQDMYASSSDSLTSFYKNKRKHSHGHNKNQTMNSISETDHNNATTTASSSSSSTANNLRTPNNQCMASTSTSTSSSSSSSNCIRNVQQFTPDSGIGTPGCSSSGSYPQTENGNHHPHHHDGNNNTNGFKENKTSADTTSMKIFQQKIARIRRNYRHNFGDDSDSD